ncbi:hypothetical protein MKEN_00420300 [Mycena kentingensis (nom. inval.)]|nr:hypothetical protein MKEN_00420300 [Mycena kentingensis (nom. inval.)]
MPSSTLSSLAILAVAAVARADYFSSNPLVNKDIPYDQIPYQVMTDRDDPRGFQNGYNICNSTTENQQSMCQTMFVNHIDDFCLWGPPEPNTTVAVSEGEMVAWCVKKGHGTRLIPGGAITSVQYVQTPSYIQIAGTFNQAMLNIGGTDGGELDSGGQDGEGNPMGGLVYTNNFPAANGNNGTYIQARHWSFFLGNNYFCGKICDQTGSNPGGLCNNIYDRLGCDYNAPASVTAGTFEVCKGDDMMPVGTYVGSDGQTSTYHQPAETVPIDYAALPYTPTPAATSSCTPFQSTALFTDIASVTPAAGNDVSAIASASASATGAAGSNTKAGSGSQTGSAATPSGTGGAMAMGVSFGAVAAGAAFVAALAL